MEEIGWRKRRGGRGIGEQVVATGVGLGGLCITFLLPGVPGLLVLRCGSCWRGARRGMSDRLICGGEVE